MNASAKYRIKFIFIFLIALTSCKKDEGFTINGRVIDYITGTPIPNAKVKVSAGKLNQFVYNSSYSEIGNATTDASGNFSIQVPSEKVSDYKINITKSGYFDNETKITQDLFKDNIYNANFGIIPEAQLRIVFKNISPYDLEDNFKFWYEGAIQNCYDCCNDNVYNFSGPNISDSISCRTTAGIYAKVNCIVEKNKKVTAFSDSILCTGDKVNVIRINY